MGDGEKGSGVERERKIEGRRERWWKNLYLLRVNWYNPNQETKTQNPELRTQNSELLPVGYHLP
jgi:hypothetical protein